MVGDNDVLSAKVESLRRCLGRIAEKTPSQYQDLLDDYDLQDIISINLERAIQNSVDIASHIIARSEEPAPETMSDAFSALAKLGVIDESMERALIAAVGFRNIAVHAYQKIDWRIVYAIITDELHIFKDFIKRISESLENS